MKKSKNDKIFKNGEINDNNYESTQMNLPNTMTQKIASLNDNLKKIKNDLISGLKKEINNKNNNNAFRNSYQINSNSIEKMNILNNLDNKNDKNILSKSLNNDKNNNSEEEDDISNTINLVNRNGNIYNNCQFYISRNTNIKITNQNKNNIKKNYKYDNNENRNKSNIYNEIKKDNNNKYGNKIGNSNNINNKNYIQKNYINNNIIKNSQLIQDDFIENGSNNIIYESNSNTKHILPKKIDSNIINNINDNNYKNINNLGEKINYHKKNHSSLNKNSNMNNNNIISNDFNQYKKNTIIINETSNNNTVINFIEIKNNYESNKLNDNANNNIENNNNNKYININFSNNDSNKSNKKYIKNELKADENDYFPIPDDGIINSIAHTFSPYKTFSVINNQDKKANLYNTISDLKKNNSFNKLMINSLDDNNDIKLTVNAKSEIDKELDININKNSNNTHKSSNINNNKTYSNNKAKISKFTLLDNFLYGKEIFNSDNYKNNNDNYSSINQFKGNNDINTYEKNNNNIKNEKMIKKNSKNEFYYDNSNCILDEDSKNQNNAITNENGDVILRRTTKKLKHRGGPEKNKINNNYNNNDGINFMKDYESYEDCTLNLSKDLKCGCTGNLDEGCYIF